MIIDEIMQKYYDFYKKNGVRPITLTVNYEQEREIKCLPHTQFNYHCEMAYRECRIKRVMGMFLEVKDGVEMSVK